MKMGRVSLIILVILFFSINSVAGVVSELKITPDKPILGDEITMSGKADPNEVLTPSITFKVKVNAAKGTGMYDYIVNNMEVPISKSVFEVKAEKVKNLNVEVGKWGLSWTFIKDATNGIAIISQGNVPAWTYNIKLYGTAADGESSVQLNMKAYSEITADNDGNFNIKYSTSKIPPGTYTLDIGGEKVTINLLEKNEKKSSVEAEDVENKKTHEIDPESTITAKTTITPEETHTPAITETPSVTPDKDVHTPVATTAAKTNPESFLHRLLSHLKFWK